MQLRSGVGSYADHVFGTRGNSRVSRTPSAGAAAAARKSVAVDEIARRPTRACEAPLWRHRGSERILSPPGIGVSLEGHRAGSGDDLCGREVYEGLVE